MADIDLVNALAGEQPQNPQEMQRLPQGFWQWHRENVADPIRNSLDSVRGVMPAALIRGAGYPNLGDWVGRWPEALLGLRHAPMPSARVGQLPSEALAISRRPSQPLPWPNSFSRAANTNKKLQIDPDPYTQATIDQTW